MMVVAAPVLYRGTGRWDNDSGAPLVEPFAAMRVWRPVLEAARLECSRSERVAHCYRDTRWWSCPWHGVDALVFVPVPGMGGIPRGRSTCTHWSVLTANTGACADEGDAWATYVEDRWSPGISVCRNHMPEGWSA